MSDLVEKSQNKLEFSAHALSDLEEIWLHFSSDSDEKADKVLKQITEKFSKLLNFPKLGRERNDLFLSLRSFPVGKFIIFYQELEAGIEIVRVIHSSRDVEQVFEKMIPLEP